MNIEDLIKKRKKELDLDIPPADIWNDIQKEWKPKKSQFHWWKIAAIVFITLSLGLLINNFSLQKKVDELATLGDISEEYREMENSYVSQINQIESELPLEQIKAQKDLSWILEELNTLEEVNQLYRKDIGVINEDQLVGVLIDYYEKRIRLLKKLELELKRTNKFNENEETNTDNINI